MTPQADLTKFLLNQLDEAEREGLQERILLEEGFAESVEASERELLDAYARHELPSEVQRLVESELLFSQRQLAKLEVARALAVPRLKARSAQPLLALAATLLILSGVGTYLAFRQHAPAQLQTPTARSSSPAVTRLSIPAFLVTPGATRGSRIQTIHVPAQVPAVRLDLELPAAFPAQAVAVRLFGSEGTQVWSAAGVTPSADGLSVEIPATVLRKGTFQLGVGTDPVVTYYFEVQ